MSNLISMKEVAKIVGVSVPTISAYVKAEVVPKPTSGTMRAGKGSNHYRWSKRALDEAMPGIRQYQKEAEARRLKNVKDSDRRKMCGKNNEAPSSFDLAWKAFNCSINTNTI